MSLPSLQSSGFCRYCEVDLGLVLINPLSNSTVLGSTAQAGCGSAFTESKQWDLSAVWHFVMSETGDAADVDRVGIYWIPQGKDCHLDCQIEDIHTVFPAHKHIVCNNSGAVFLTVVCVMFVFNGCFFLASVYKHSATQLRILTHCKLSKDSTPEDDLPLI